MLSCSVLAAPQAAISAQDTVDETLIVFQRAAPFLITLLEIIP